MWLAVQCYIDVPLPPNKDINPRFISLKLAFLASTQHGVLLLNLLFDSVDSPNPLNDISSTGPLTTISSWSAHCSLPRVEEAILPAVTTQTDSALLLSG